jgi:osmotically-inducible protein OsmY
MKTKIWGIAIAALLLLPLFAQASTKRQPASLEQQVRHELLMLPRFNVFDNLAFRIEGARVVLLGEVTWPNLKNEAGRVVRAIPGVEAVDNRIEVLPLSPLDNRIRYAELRAIYRQPGFQKYGMGTQPSIRIIVRNGNVTLEGVVDRQTDKSVAELEAKTVSGVFSVTNNLRVVKP